MVEQAKRQIWRNGGRFYGYRINCEQVPMLGACTVRAILDDPRMIPYLVVWKSRKGNEVKQTVRLARSGRIQRRPTTGGRFNPVPLLRSQSATWQRPNLQPPGPPALQRPLLGQNALMKTLQRSLSPRRRPSAAAAHPSLLHSTPHDQVRAASLRLAPGCGPT